MTDTNNSVETEGVASESKAAPTPPTTPPRGRRRFARFLTRLVLMVVVPAASALIGAYFYVESQRYVTSENAYVKTDKVTIASEVSGKTLAVEVREHDKVEAGEMLPRLHEEPYRIAPEHAAARRGSIRTQIESRRASHRVKGAETKVGTDELAYYDNTLQSPQKTL